MKREFKVGDRIAVYGQDFDGNPKRCVTTVEEVLGNGLLYINANDCFKPGKYDLTMPHDKQCRHLNPKPKTVKITRKKLAEAWDLVCGDVNCYTCKSEIVAKLCKQFGLEDK